MIENINLAKYTERNYEVTDSRSGWMDYGDDNLFPQYLIGLYNGSAVHSALISSIAYMIFGNGIELEGEAQLQIEKWGLNDEIRKACVDLKLQGGFYLEVAWSLDRSYIKSVRHIPFEEVRSGYMDVNGDVQTYYHCLDWEKYRSVGTNEIQAWSPEKKNESPVQLVACKPFTVGSHYYPKPDYMGAINWVEVDKEIAIFHNNNIANGMSPGFSIHWKNGIPTKEKRAEIRRDVERQLTGSKNAGKFWMTFSDGGDTVPDIQPMELSDAHDQFQFLSEEATNKIMIGHRVTSPALFGVKTAGNLGSTEELKTASYLFERNVIKPYQRFIKEWVAVLLNESGISETPTLNASPFMFNGLDLSDAFEYLNSVGEEVTEEWELVDESEFDYDLEAVLDATWNFAKVPSSNPNGKSEQDTEIVKVRYVYAPETTDAKGESRDFCRKMIKAGKVYRKEDIEQASDRAVNPGLGAGGSNTYDLFLYKGGANCHHFWKRQTYLRKDNKKISVNEAKALIRKAGTDAKRIPENSRKVAQRPWDMPNHGYINPR